jgi:hypothetical protein
MVISEWPNRRYVGVYNNVVDWRKHFENFNGWFCGSDFIALGGFCLLVTMFVVTFLVL